jgi:predicted ribosomally synthesized peptide with nif11-like leader
MSLENAKLFIEAASQDPELQQKLATVREPADVIRLAVQASSERGLPFTSEELLASIGPAPAEGTELHAEQLEAVAGGAAGDTPEQLARRRWIYSIFRS